MNSRISPLSTTLPAAFVTTVGIFAFSFTPLVRAQEAAAEPEAQGRSMLSDPRLRNMLRSVKDESEAALAEVSKDPEEAVRSATRVFQENIDKIDPDKVEAAAAKIQSDGVVDKVTDTIAPFLPENAEDKPTAVSALEVPATRPAPGISGGEPTPVAMPINPEEALPGEPRPGENTATAADTPPDDTVVRQGRVATIPGAAPTTPMIPDSPGLTPDEIPPPTPLARKYAPGSGGSGVAPSKNQLEIRSDKSIMDSARGVLLFTGNVEVSSPDFQIKCDKIEIHLAEGFGAEAAKGKPSDVPFKRATASGGMVEIKRTTIEDGKRKTQIAIARSLDYNATTKDIVLSGGPPYIQDGDRFIKTNAPDAKIIMRGDGKYEITGTGNRSQIVIPIPAGKDGKGGNGGLDGALTSPFDGIR